MSDGRSRIWVHRRAPVVAARRLVDPGKFLGGCVIRHQELGATGERCRLLVAVEDLERHVRREIVDDIVTGDAAWHRIWSLVGDGRADTVAIVGFRAY